MTILVAGHIMVKAGQRQRFLDGSTEAMRLARSSNDCDDFVVAADPLDANRVNIFERWRSRDALHAFRDTGPDDDLTDLIVRARVNEYEV